MATGSFDFLQNSSNSQASGALSGQRLIYRYLCGASSNPTSLAWPLPSLNLMFKTDGSITDRGFNMSYNIQPCGGLLEGPQTQILSPGYPAEYPASSHCQWIIEFTEGSQIQFTANAFSVARCRPVLLDVHMPPPTYMPPLYRCQYASPHPALARQTISPFGMDPILTPLFSGPAVAPLSLPISCRCRTRFSHLFLPSLDGPSQVLAEFVSDQSGSSTGFNITATEHTTGCGGILHGMVS